VTAHEDQTPGMFYRGSSPAAKANGRDLENIVTLIELAAIHLTPKAGAVFTADELYEEAVWYGGESIELLRVDSDIVLKSASGILKREPGGKWSLK